MPNRGNFPLQPDNPEAVYRTALVSGRQSGPSTAPMPNARPWRRGQAPEPRSGAPKAPGWTATPAVAAQSFGPSVAAEHAIDSTGDIVPKRASATPRFHTTLTGTTRVRPTDRADGAKPVGGVMAVVAHHQWAPTYGCPNIGVCALLPYSGLILKPDLDRRTSRAGLLSVES
jgi:hypothetical protein